MPKKQKKTLNKKSLKKSKIKSVVNVKINIDNSKKPTMRRASTKAPQQQPFANFPSYQPTRIQQLEPKQQFNNADLTKTMDEYQKQFKVYLEAKDLDAKKLIEKFDDSLKKNIAPTPGAFDVYADRKGEVVYEGPVKKDTWDNRNELKGNTMLETEAESLTANQLIGEARPVTTKEVVRGLEDQELKEVESELKYMKIEKKIYEKYQDYVSAYKQYHGDDDENYVKNMYDNNGKPLPANAWSKRESHLIAKIKKFGTYEAQLEKEAEMKELEEINKQINKRQSKKNKKQEAKLKSKTAET